MEVKTQVYRIFSCPRCKNLTWNPNKNEVGDCSAWKMKVVNIGDPLTSHVDSCKYFEQGKPKAWDKNDR
jgi:hypothetical protein